MIVELEQNNGVAEIVLNHPKTRNAITGPMGMALADALNSASKDEQTKCVLLRGAEGAFCSGLNLKEFNAEPPPPWLKDFGKIWRNAHLALFNCPKPIVVALEKFAINGGAALALAGDLLVVGEDSYLQVGEVRQGMAAPYNMAWLRLRFSEYIAAQLTISGRRYTGAELLNKGIAYAAPSTSDTVSAAREICAELASFPRDALQRIKTVMCAYRPEDGSAWFDQATANSSNSVKPSKVIGG
ncbi:MAG: enoyl-CoA hydratase/isomerase family protein [Gammaproteobacteria bacterium]|nr:enoyl-CoA hydratase/isomerase family protein [Gammaproteobacteria bacterium]